MTTLGSTGIDIFPLVLGGNTFGWTANETDSGHVLDAFAEGGGNFVDTADVYAAWVDGNSGGESETIIGDWIAARGHRDRVVLGTKVSQHPDYSGLSAGNVLAAAEASLARLRTDYIDIYYAHFDDPNTPLEETVEAFHDLILAGKVRAIGISNYSADRIREWIAIAEERGLTLPAVLQPHYNLVARDPFESDLAPIAAEHSLAVLPYFSLASGFLTGKYRTEGDFAGASRDQMAKPYFTRAGLAVVDRLQELAIERDTTPATLALSWLRQRPHVVAPIASARTVEQLPGLMASTSLELTASETKSLDALSARVPA